MTDALAEEIEELIDEIGREVTIRSYTNSGVAYDPTRTLTGENAANATISNFRAREADGNIIQANDKNAHIVASATVTMQDGILDDDGIEYRIINLRTVRTGSTKFLYIAQLRSGT